MSKSAIVNTRTSLPPLLGRAWPTPTQEREGHIYNHIHELNCNFYFFEFSFQISNFKFQNSKFKVSVASGATQLTIIIIIIIIIIISPPLSFWVGSGLTVPSTLPSGPRQVSGCCLKSTQAHSRLRTFQVVQFS